jgi:hypothetical protein
MKGHEKIALGRLPFQHHEDNTDRGSERHQQNQRRNPKLPPQEAARNRPVLRKNFWFKFHWEMLCRNG